MHINKFKEVFDINFILKESFKLIEISEIEIKSILHLMKLEKEVAWVPPI